MRPRPAARRAETIAKLARQYTQTAASLSLQAGSTSASVSVGTVDDSGEWVTYGVLDVTPVNEFLLR